MKPNSIIYLITGFVLCLPAVCYAQLERERVVTSTPVEDTFWATKNVGISTTINPSGNDLHSSVLHTFGLVDGGIDRFFGLDDGANTRLGLIYGITDRVSIGLGRMTFRKVVDVSTKMNLLRQTTDGSVPLSIALKGATGISTLSGLGLEFSDRLSYFTSLMIAKKFNGFSVQLSPMYSHFNRTLGQAQEDLLGLGVLLNVELNEQFSLSGEYLPVFGDRNPGTEDAMAIALNINTGGHVFQIFFASSQWHNEQFVMANNRDRFWEGDFRFGFNIHRVFGLGGR
ncbi:DUF5777 family beta-barrel protein [Rhodohalobacter sulfatireducens]|uniref:DUF5777 family beta-barrel protein n=1 Tax=Rhodohalobacter sulfatireducens TaxID=2911366 RepID=A0ABS9KAR0_9BACT|nr:DUF5777 family beta-barrel protein [Rhodohalobacter sulfatireducens]MCG2587938.1 DUF5777 family beta-barrel protein [Rhodohalobacter sulfatireducens]